MSSRSYNQLASILGISLLIWLVQMLPYFIGMYNGGPANFSTFLYKGAIGITQDLVTYGFQANHALQEPSFFRVDPTTIDHKTTHFPEGNIIPLIVGLGLGILGNLTWVSIILPLPFLLISVYFLDRLVNMLFEKHHIQWTMFISFCIFLTGYDDILGIRKILDFIEHGTIFISKTNSLVMGYMHRFPNSQISFAFFLGWVFFLLKYLNTENKKDLYYLVLLMALNQYVYFYYWSFQLVLSGLVLLPQFMSRWKQILGPLSLYLILVSPFWVNYYWFIQSEASADFSELISGLDHYSFWGTLAFYCLYFLLTSKKNWLLLVLPLIFIAGVEVLTYTFQEFHWMFKTGKVLLLIFLAIGTLIFMLTQEKRSPIASLANATYWSTFILVHLKFIIGFNIEPYHWVYIGSYPLLVFCIVHALSQKKSLNRVETISLFSLCVAITAVFNGTVYALVNTDYWQWTREEKTILNHLNNQDSTLLVAGNNFAQVASLCVNSKQKLYTGIAHLSDLSKEESSKRLIHSYRLMGYNDQQIMNQFHAYRNRDKYEIDYENRKDSLARQWPANFTLIAEVILDYWHPATDFQKAFEQILHKNALSLSASPDLLIVQEPHLLAVDSSYRKVIATPTLSLYKKSSE